MKGKKTTRRALVMSLLSLLLCCSMLVGTTFAWFTDSVTSGQNQIIAGNLDVDVYYGDPAAKNSINNVATLFNDVTLWEPGAVAWENLTVVNLGTLALKYELAVNFADQNAVKGTGAKLSEALKVAVIEGGIDESLKREQVLEKAGTGTALASFTETGKLLPKGSTQTAEGGDVEKKTYGIVIWWEPSAEDNKWNVQNGAETTDNKPLQIDLGISLVATQLTYEYDSFGKDYDKGATYSIDVSTAEELAKALMNGGTANVLNDITVDETLVIPAGIKSALKLNGHTVTGTMHKDNGAVINNSGDLVITGGTVTSSAGNGGSALMNKGTATVINATLNGAPNEGNGWPSYTVNNIGTLTINDSTITSVHGGVCSYGDGAVATLNNTNLDMSGIPGKTSHGLYTYNDGKIVVNGGSLANKAADQNATGGSVINGNVEVFAGNFTGRIENYYGTPAIYGGTFSANPSKYAKGNTVTDNGDGTWTVTPTQANLKNDINNAQSGDTVRVPVGENTLPTLSGKEGITVQGVNGSVIGGENATTGFDGNFGKGNTYKDLTFTGSTNGARWTYGNGGTITFENCQFLGQSVYGFHMDVSNGATLIFNNCTFSGFNAFASDLVKVTFNNCTFLHNGNYGHTNIWSVGEFNGCTFGDKTSVSQGYSSAENKYYGTLIFDGVEESYHHEFIGTAEGLIAFEKSVNEGNDSWNGQKVILVDDINLSGKTWTPIGQTGSTQFKGIFDGNGHTIKNLTIDSSAQTGKYYSSGLFGWLNNATVKNVTVDGATVTGNHNVAVIAGYLETAGCTVSNCHVTNATVVAKHANNEACGDKAGVIVGHAGNTGVKVDGCTATNSTVTAGRDAGQIVGAALTANVTGCTATNVAVTATGDCTGANVNNAVIGRILG